MTTTTKTKANSIGHDARIRLHPIELFDFINRFVAGLGRNYTEMLSWRRAEAKSIFHDDDERM